MSERSRLPDSLRWRAVGWMEMGLSQVDAARRLNVSRSVVHRDCFIALSARWGRRISVPQLVPDYSIASGRRISSSTVPRCLHNAGLYARLSIVCEPLNRQRPAYLGQENTFPGLDNSDGILYSLQTSPDLHWRAIQDVYSSGENEAPDIINPTLLKDIVIEVVE
ncbi:uncharacterized protein TNCV_4296761 [Trichonephila clavipes]|nr:uncharacterized protein TNCV_4296761 [Trichonephila clavipes]